MAGGVAKHLDISEVGGNESDVSPTPEPGNRFRLRLRLRCVRACERAKLRARDDSSVARRGRRDLWGVRSGPVRAPVPIKSVRAPVRIKSSSFSSSDRCFVISLTQCIFLGVGPMRFRVFRACFVVLAWLGRGLGPPAWFMPALPWSWSPGLVYASAPVVLV